MSLSACQTGKHNLLWELGISASVLELHTILLFVYVFGNVAVSNLDNNINSEISFVEDFF